MFETSTSFSADFKENNHIMKRRLFGVVCNINGAGIMLGRCCKYCDGKGLLSFMMKTVARKCSGVVALTVMVM